MILRSLIFLHGALLISGQLVSSTGSTSGATSGGGPIVSGGGTGPGPMFPMVPHAPTAIHHVGIGYNILTGNPDGQYWSTGGEDPGVSLTRKIFTITAGDHPPEVVVEHHDGCQYSHGFTLFHSTKSYQDKLLQSVKTSGAADQSLKAYAFTLSSAFQAVAQQTSHHHYVFQDATTYCTMGHVRYSANLAATDKYPVTREFAQDVCSLPTTYDHDRYMRFIDDWGTHVTTEITVGKLTTNRFVGRLKDLFNFVMFNVTDEISMGGPLYGYPESYVIDLDSYKYRHEYKYIVGVFEDTLTVGDMYNNDVIGRTVETLDTAFDPKYWQYMSYYVTQGLCPSSASGSLAAWKANIIQGLGDYPAYKQAIIPAVQPLAMPVTWPLGTYSMPKPASGCGSGFMEGTVGMTMASHTGGAPTGMSLDGALSSTHYDLKYCTKEHPSPTQFDIYWPKGDYCIQQYDSYCPYAFRLGEIQFRLPSATTKTDRDDPSCTCNPALPELLVVSSSIVPTGTYGTTTQLRFCCRNDTVYTQKIFLPNNKPFFLFRFQHGCQQVQGMKETEQTLTFYNDIQTSGKQNQTDLLYSYPFVETVGPTAYGARQYKLHYCYYSPLS